MKLFKYICGMDERYGAAENEDEAYEHRTKVDPTYDYVHVRIEEVVIPGYTITLTAVADEFDAMDKTNLRKWLDSKGVEYTPQLGESKLREIARAASV